MHNCGLNTSWLCDYQDKRLKAVVRIVITFEAMIECLLLHVIGGFLSSQELKGEIKCVYIRKLDQGKYMSRMSS